MAKKPHPKRKVETKSESRRKLFAAEYVIDLNATGAAKRAGYTGTPKALGVTGSRLLAIPSVAADIASRQARMLDRLSLTAENVTREVALLAFGDLGDLYDASGALKRPHELTRDQRALIASLEMDETRVDGVAIGTVSKMKRYSKVAALTLASDLLGLRKQIDPGQGGTLTINIAASDGKAIR